MTHFMSVFVFEITHIFTIVLGPQIGKTGFTKLQYDSEFALRRHKKILTCQLVNIDADIH